MSKDYTNAMLYFNKCVDLRYFKNYQIEKCGLMLLRTREKLKKFVTRKQMHLILDLTKKGEDDLVIGT